MGRFKAPWERAESVPPPSRFLVYADPENNVSPQTALLFTETTYHWSR